MKRHVFTLALLLVISTSGCERSSQPAENNRTNQNGGAPLVSALSAQECKDLGGTVEPESKCDSGQQCRTVIYNPAGPPKSFEKCITKQQ